MQFMSNDGLWCNSFWAMSRITIWMKSECKLKGCACDLRIPKKYANWFYGWFRLRRFFVDLPHIYSDSEISDVKEGRTFTLWLFTCIFINRISALIDLSLLVVRWTHERICVRVCVCVCARVQRSIQMMATLQSLCRMRQIESEWNLCLPLSIKYTFSMFVRAETALTDCLIKIQFGWNRKTCLHQHNYKSGNGHKTHMNTIYMLS